MNKANGSPSEATQFTVNHRPPITIRRKSPYSQAIELQELLLSDARNPGVKATARAQVARAWDVLEERKARLEDETQTEGC